jgi:eukaryotic-like serine/threonine-protein kinase
MSPDLTRDNRGPVASAPADGLGSDDDPRIASVLAGYLADLEAGRQPSREGLLRSNPEIADALADWFDVVEFVQSAAASATSTLARSPAGDALPPDTMLGEYRLVREIGRGGMGIVYEAVQFSLGRRVALKVLSGTAALDPLRLQRFQIETQAVAQLHHPHIVPIFAAGSAGGTHHYAMQFIDGTTLAQMINHERRFGGRSIGPEEDRPLSSGSGVRSSRPNSPTGPGGPPVNGAAASNGPAPASPALSGTSSLLRRGALRALARLGIQAAEALAHAHAMGILHRDIKPSNLLVDARGHLWVTDFGLAQFQGEPGPTRTGDLLGTLRYMPPELVQGHEIVRDPRSDIYSLGATFYELLTKRPAFDGREHQALLRQIVEDEPVPPRRIDPAIPRDLETIVLKAMDKEPARRYQTADALAQDLRLYLDDKTIRARRPGTLERSIKWARRHRVVLRATAAVAFIALAISMPVFWWLERKRSQADQDFRVTFGHADAGFEQMIRLSDELTAQGMNRYAEPATTPETAKIRDDFFRQAVEFYERLVREPRFPKPMIALAHRRLGLARLTGMHDLRAESELRQALTIYDELLAASPGDPELRAGISDVQMSLAMFSILARGINASADVLRRVAAIDEGLATEFPDNPAHRDRLIEHRIQIAIWMVTHGERAKADQGLRELIESCESLPAGTAASTHATAAACRRLAKAFGDVGRPREQQKALRRGLELEPNDPALQNELGRALALDPDAPPSDQAEAIELLKRAVAANPNDRASWNTLGMAQLRAGQMTAALEAVKKSMELARPREHLDGSDQFLMAIISFRRGDKPAALDWYMQAVDWLSSSRSSDRSVAALRAETERLLGRKRDEGRIPGPAGHR